MKLIRIKGRYPLEPAIMRPENMKASIHRNGGEVVIRIAETQHLDFWIELTIRGTVARVVKLIVPQASEN